MPNAIKYNVSTETLSLKKGNFWIGTGDVGKGPTSTSGFYNGITPPSGGYTIYLNKASNGPSIYVASNDAELISRTNQIAGTSYTTANECFNYYASQTDKMVFNKDYTPLVTNGLVFNMDASFVPSYPRNGTTWYDISSLGNSGTLVNGPYFDSTGSLVFDGADDSVYCTNFGISQTFTVSSWIKCTNVSGENNIVSKNGPYFMRISNSKVRFNVLTDSGWLFQNGTTTLLNNKWYNLVMTYDGSSFKGYINSVLEFNTSKTGSIVSNAPFYIGYTPEAGENGGFYGNISSVMVHNRSLTLSEILQNYYQGSIVTSNLLVVLDASNLVSYDGTGTTWRDLTSNGSNGTLYNGPTFSSDGGGSIIFDGSDDYSDISIPSITSYGTITICAFIKWLSFGDDMFFGMTTYDVWTYANTLGFNSGAGNVVGISSSTVTSLGLLGNWKHYTFVMNSSGLLSNNKIYINGVSVGSLSAVVGGDASTPSFATNLRLCGWNNDGGYRSNIQYGNFQVYNRELTVGEINQNFNAQRGRFGI
jgi:hypothetical protein